jgi:hypothetical protein
VRRLAPWLVTLLVGWAQAQPLQSDAARLNLPFESGRTVLWVVPPLDHRHLVEANPRSRTFFGDLLRALSARANLDVRVPVKAIAAIQRSTERTLPLIRATRDRGLKDYQQVRLGEAAEGLQKAVEGFLSIGHHWVAPAEVARAAQTRGLALLERGEQGDEAAAEEAFELGLLIDPSVRLRPGVDRPAAVEAQARVRAGLAQALPAVQGPRPPLPPGAVLQVRLLPDRVDVVLREGTVIIPDQQLLAMPDPTRPPDRASRPKNRLLPTRWPASPRPIAKPPSAWPPASGPACPSAVRPAAAPRPAPCASTRASWASPSPRHPPRPSSTWGWASMPASSWPATWPSRRGPASPSAPAIARKISARICRWGGLYVGPGFFSEFGRLRTTAGLGVELAVMGPVTTTTNPACKFFNPGDVPTRICDFDRDIDRRPTAWMAGPTLSLGASVRVVDEITLGVRLQGSLYLFRSEDNGLDRPVGGQVVLGYPLF